MKIKTILIIVAIIAVIWLLFSSFSKAGKSTYSGTLVSAGPKAGSTNAYYNLNKFTTQISYWLTYTPDSYTPTGRASVNPADLPQSKEISAASYRAFITKYPKGIADGNVLNQYS